MIKCYCLFVIVSVVFAVKNIFDRLETLLVSPACIFSNKNLSQLKKNAHVEKTDKTETEKTDKLTNFKLIRNFEIRRNDILSTDLTQFGTSLPPVFKKPSKESSIVAWCNKS